VGQEESLDIISGDLLVEAGPGEFEFHHSFQTTALVLEETAQGQLLRGPVKIHRDDMIDIARLDLLIPDTGDLVATYTFYQLTQKSGRQTALTLSFTLARQSDFFRRIDLEVDQVIGVPLPNVFQPSNHPQTPADYPDRLLTFENSYRDAGIDLAVTLGGEDVPVSESGLDGLWTDEELHAAMNGHFVEHRDVQQWFLYLLLATEYVKPSVLGIMFDSDDDSPRQGSAVFHDHPAISNAVGEEQNREYLYTIVHELGHALNMLHAFQKGIFETHGVLPRPGSLSWMNYPQLYPFGYAFPSGWDGSGSFWSQFRFEFDPDELAHLRHNDSSEVIMGGRSFGFAGHLKERPFEIPSSEGDLSLVLWTPPALEFLQQLEADIRLRNDGARPVTVRSNLFPAAGSVDLLVRRPLDRFPKVYRYIYQACVRDDLTQLKPGESLYQELNPSFGSRHWFLDEPGTYELQAVYNSVDGSKVASNVARVRILHPSPEADRLAPDFFTLDTGVYLSVEGSRADPLQRTAEGLEEVGKIIPKSAIARQIFAANAFRDTRVFKDLQAKKVTKADRKRAAKDLCKALRVNMTKYSVSLDPSQSHLKISRTLRLAAAAAEQDGDKKTASAIFQTLEGMLRKVKAPKQAGAELKDFRRSLKA